MRKIVAIIGDGTVGESHALYTLARDAGRCAVDAGLRVMTGGLRGVMEAACRGAHESKLHHDGDTIGIMPGTETNDANAWVDIAIATGLQHTRNTIVAQADAIVAVGGGAGTLVELAFAWIHARPIVALGSEGWSHALAGKSIDERRGEITVEKASSAKDAIDRVMRALARPTRT